MDADREQNTPPDQDDDEARERPERERDAGHDAAELSDRVADHVEQRYDATKQAQDDREGQ